MNEKDFVRFKQLITDNIRGSHADNVQERTGVIVGVIGSLDGVKPEVSLSPRQIVELMALRNEDESNE